MMQQNTRYDYLDAVRGFALLLGIVFHASISFIPIFIGWAVMDISTSHVVSIFMLISHSFRMELFFLIAGFFTHMKWHKDGVKRFLTSRIVRIALPFIVLWFLLRPLIVSGWVIGAESMQGEADILGGLIFGFMSLAELPKDLLVGTHLWFLYYLLLISAGVVILRKILGANTTIYARCNAIGDSITAWLSHSRTALLLVCIPTAMCLWFMERWGMDTPDKSLIPHIPVLLVYCGFFGLGYCLHRNADTIVKFGRLSWSKLIFCLGAIIATVVLAKFEMQLAHPQYSLIKSGYMFSYALMMWTLVSLSIGLCHKLFSKSNSAIRYLADASYWMYLIHLPLVVWLQIAFAELPLHWSIKLVSISAITIGISLLFYDAFVRSTFIGAWLNGKRKPRVLFASRNNKPNLLHKHG